MHQFSLPSYTTVNYGGIVTRGHPVWRSAFSTVPGTGWRAPARSVYLADACMARGPVTYPSQNYKGYGSSVIRPSSEPVYRDESAVSRRSADRHLGTNALFLDGSVQTYETAVLNAMSAGDADCVWDVD